MRICVINQRASALYFPDSSEIFGGAEVESYMLGKLFVELGHEVHVLLGDGAREYLTHGSHRLHGVSLHAFSRNNRIDGWVALWKQLDAINPDLVFIKLISETSAVAATWCRLKRRAFIYRAANRRDLLLASGSKAYGRIQSTLFNLTCHSRSFVLAQTGEQEEALRKRLGPDQVGQIGNYMHLVPCEPPEYAERSGILWVGHLMPVKRPEVVLELAKAYPDLPFKVVASTAPDVPVAAFEAELQAQPNVHYLKNLPFHETQQHFLSARALLNTSSSEGFPNTFLQALHAGLPLATTGIDPARLIENHSLGFASEELQELGNWLQAQHDSEPLWRVSSLRARSYFATCMSIEAYKTSYQQSIARSLALLK